MRSFLSPPACVCAGRWFGNRRMVWAAAALAMITVSGCITPAQELNFIDHRLMQRQAPRPPVTQVAGS